MKFPFLKPKNEGGAPAAKPEAKKSAETKLASLVVPASKKSDTPEEGKKRILVGSVLLGLSFLSGVYLFYLTINAQTAKEAQVKNLREKLVLVSTEKEVANEKAKNLQSQVGKVLDLERLVEASKKVHGLKENERKEGSLWIDRKNSRYMVSLGVLNGVAKGSLLSIYDGSEKIASFKVITAMDVVSYGEPEDKKMIDFLKDYYKVKLE